MGNSFITIKKYAHLVVDVKPNSPGEKCGLVANEDFIIMIDENVLMYLNGEEMQDLLTQSENRELEVVVYSSASNSVRKVVLRPTRDWPGEGLLGITLNVAPFTGYKQIKLLVKGVGDPVNYKTEQRISEAYDGKENTENGELASHNPLFRQSHGRMEF